MTSHRVQSSGWIEDDNPCGHLILTELGIDNTGYFYLLEKAKRFISRIFHPVVKWGPRRL